LNIGIQGFLVFDVRGYDVEGGSYVTTRMEVLVKKQLVEEMKLKIVGIGAISDETGAIFDDHSLLQFNFKKTTKLGSSPINVGFKPDPRKWVVELVPSD
jgi:hypothetical protein